MRGARWQSEVGQGDEVQVGQEERRKDRDQENDRQDDRADDREPVTSEASSGVAKQGVVRRADDLDGGFSRRCQAGSAGPRRCTPRRR